MYLDYTTEEKALRAELRAYFERMMTPELEAEILAWSVDKLAKYKTPRSIDFVEELPRDPNGKLYKRKLRDPYWEGRERSI